MKFEIELHHAAGTIHKRARTHQDAHEEAERLLAAFPSAISCGYFDQRSGRWLWLRHESDHVDRD